MKSALRARSVSRSPRTPSKQRRRAKGHVPLCDFSMVLGPGRARMRRVTARHYYRGSKAVSGARSMPEAGARLPRRPAGSRRERQPY
ncbi:hypothetical protein EVAR_60617_1 [Eumeta japonica]|uniref:Uncharacterized protein n=1 Tax=Eumeta variegata TaxID=151549 RepID=A0A4C1YDF8_EUMVA|nr:hypothetical protein EVAR_60617_1 [Eumeta japonica]